MAGKFQPEETWKALLRDTEPITVYMAVPTIYHNLYKWITDPENNLPSHHMMSSSTIKEQLAKNRHRLMVSGSAALPQTMHTQWEQLTGLRLLERFGMTETLLVLSNPYEPASDRISGKVGMPFKGAKARLMDLEGQDGENYSSDGESIAVCELLEEDEKK